jgi:hypothetical protein
MRVKLRVRNMCGERVWSWAYAMCEDIRDGTRARNSSKRRFLRTTELAPRPYPCLFPSRLCLSCLHRQTSTSPRSPQASNARQSHHDCRIPIHLIYRKDGTLPNAPCGSRILLPHNKRTIRLLRPNVRWPAATATPRTTKCSQ